MKIDYLRLNNWRGIYDGMRRYEIELDFTKSEHRIVILVGRNGSGKSTILSALTPFMNTFDNRKDLILDGKVGEKEIHYSFPDGTRYVILHKYEPRKNKSFIKRINKDGSEEDLNPNGGVQTFVKVIQDVFGITEEVFMINSIGSQAANVIDLSSSARKEYISQFTPNVEPFLEIYSKVNNQLNGLTKTLKYLATEIDKLPPEEEITHKKFQTSSSLKTEEERLQGLYKKEGEYEALFSSSEKALAEIKTLHTNLDALEEEYSGLDEKLRDILANSSYLELLDEDFEACRATISKELSESGSRIEAHAAKSYEASDKFAAKRNELSILKTNLESINNEIRNLSGGENLLQRVANLRKTIEDRSIKVDTAKEFLDLNITQVFGENFDSIDFINELNVADLQTIIKALINASDSTRYDSYQMRFINTPSNKMCTFNEAARILEVKVNDLEKEIKVSSDKIKSYKASLSNKSKIGKAKELLTDSGIECTKKGCKCDYHLALESIDVEDDSLNLLDEEQRRFEELSEECEAYSELMEDFYSKKVPSNIKEIFEDKIYFDLITAFDDFDDASTIFDILNRPYILYGEENASKMNGLIGFLKSVVNVVNANLEYNVLRDDISKFTLQLQSLESTEKTILDLNEKKVDLEEKISETSKDFEELRENAILLETVLNKMRQLQNILTVANDTLRAISVNDEQYAIISDRLEDEKKRNERLFSLEDERKVNKRDINETKERITSLNEEVRSLELQSLRRVEFNEKVNEINAQKDQLALIKNATDIKSGIPLHMIGGYLGSVKKYANDLLNIAFNGRFLIDFIISDKEFLIPVYKDSTLSTPDIKLCSQGEQSLVKTSLSLGLVSRAVETSSNIYNIISLDEIDSELDSNNRQSFLDMLNRQLDHLKCQQCFIITHNDSFSASPAGMVLLEGNNFDVEDKNMMFNKDIVFSV